MDWVRTLGTFEEPRPPAERSEPFPDENMGGAAGTGDGNGRPVA